jgi:hypothetical protein
MPGQLVQLVWCLPHLRTRHEASVALFPAVIPVYLRAHDDISQFHVRLESAGDADEQQCTRLEHGDGPFRDNSGWRVARPGQADHDPRGTAPKATDLENGSRWVPTLHNLFEMDPNRVVFKIKSSEHNHRHVAAANHLHLRERSLKAIQDTHRKGSLRRGTRVDPEQNAHPHELACSLRVASEPHIPPTGPLTYWSSPPSLGGPTVGQARALRFPARSRCSRTPPPRSENACSGANSRRSAPRW